MFLSKFCAWLGAILFVLGCPAVALSQQIDERRLRSELERMMADYDLPALAAAVVQRKGDPIVAAVGNRRYKIAKPVTDQDQFSLGSDTKAITAVLLALLVQEKRLDWETTIEEVFPDLRERMASDIRSVTVKELLSHHSGLSVDPWPRGKNRFDMYAIPVADRPAKLRERQGEESEKRRVAREQRKTYVRLILSERPERDRSFRYSNRNYAVAGAIAERIAEKPWEDLVAQRIFEPLGMNCGFGPMGTRGKFDQPLQYVVKGKEHIPVPPGLYADNPPVIGPAATIHCSVGDWAKFIQELLRAYSDGTSKLGLTRETVQRLFSDPFPQEEHPKDASCKKYGLGWCIEKSAAGMVLSHDGSNGSSYACASMEPDRGFAVLVMTNQADPPEPFKETMKACQEAIMKIKKKHVQP